MHGDWRSVKFVFEGDDHNKFKEAECLSIDAPKTNKTRIKVFTLSVFKLAATLNGIY